MKGGNPLPGNEPLNGTGDNMTTVNTDQPTMAEPLTGSDPRT